MWSLGRLALRHEGMMVALTERLLQPEEAAKLDDVGFATVLWAMGKIRWYNEDVMKTLTDSLLTRCIYV